MDWFNHFAKGLELLDDYDHENLDKKGLSKRKAKYPELAQYQEVIRSMRLEFESDVFGKETLLLKKTQSGRLDKLCAR